MGEITLRVVGSGDAFNAAGRGHSCYWLDGMAAGPLMVDFGATALEGCVRLGLDPSRLSAVLLTHLHGDHLAGLPFLLIDGLFRHLRTTDLEIVGPPPVEERLDQLHRVCYGDIVDRQRPFEFLCHEILPGQSRSVGGARLRAAAADHMDPPEQALIFSLESPEGCRVVFSGDTTMTPELLAMARGADLLVAECSGLAHPAGRHCTWQEWLEVLPGLDVGRVLLTHLSEDVRAAVPRLKGEIPPGVELLFADDGLTLSVCR